MDFEGLKQSVVSVVDNLGKTEVAVGVFAAGAISYSLWKLVQSSNLPPGPTGKFYHFSFQSRKMSNFDT